MELDLWLREHPPEARGLKAHAAELQRLRGLGYTQEQMRAWLKTQGLSVSRQAISKFFCTTTQPQRNPAQTPSNPAQPSAIKSNGPASASKPGATQEPQRCNKPPNPSAEPPPEPAEHLTLKARAQAVGDRYLQQTLSPLAAQLLSSKT